MAKAKAKAAPMAASVSDVLDELADLVPKKTPVAKGKASKWELPLDADASKAFERWSEGKAVLEPVQKRVDAAKEEVNEACLKEMTRRLFDQKSKPSNPEIKTRKASGEVDHQAVFLMTDKFKYRFPEVPEGVPVKSFFADIFVGLGMSRERAVELIENEINFTPITGIRNLNELLQGHYGEGREFIPATEDEQNVARKLVDFVKTLTPDERALILERDNGISVKQGFYDRVATYCETAGELEAVFKLIQPIVYPSYPKFALSDSPVAQTERKIAAARSILEG